MDNLTHTLAATALAKTRIGTRLPLSAAALVVAANLPDLDIVAGLWESPAYLVHHRGITHSVLGIVLQALALTALFAWLERRGARRRGDLGPRPSHWATLPAVLAGLVSHFLLDALNTYGVRPWLPFSNRWYYGDLVFIVDPYLWLLFAAMTFAPRPHARWGHVAFALFALGTGHLVLTHPRAPEFLRTIYPAALFALALLRWRGVPAFATKLWIAGGCAMLALYLGALALARHVAARNLSPAPAVMSPQPAQPWAWNAIQVSETEIAWQPLALGDDQTPATRATRNLDRPDVQHALQSEKGQGWLRFARVPFASVEEAGGASLVHLMDARYQQAPPATWSGVRVGP